MSELDQFIKAAAMSADRQSCDARGTFNKAVAVKQAIDIPAMEERYPLVMGLVSKFTSYPLAHKKISLQVDAQKSVIGIAISDIEDDVSGKEVVLYAASAKAMQLSIHNGDYTLTKTNDLLNVVEPLSISDRAGKMDQSVFKDEASAAMHLAEWFGEMLPDHPAIAAHRETGLQASHREITNNALRTQLLPMLRRSLTPV